MTTIEIILASLVFVLSIISIILTSRVIRLRNSIRLLAISYAKIETLTSLKNNDDMNNDVHKENFIKFLSDSRDWAYEYIKEVQDELERFVNEIEPEISYFDEYGLVGDAYPHYHSMKKISEEYKKLKKMLPSEE
jgi:alpha-L-fucosidase